MKLLFLLSLVLASCAPVSQESKSTHMSLNKLVSTKGEPETIRQNEIDESSKMYDYSDASYQVQGEKVLAKFSKPKNSEKSIQFWRHKFKDDNYFIESYEKTEHTQNFKLINKKKNLEILFNESGTVQRIAQKLGGQNE